MKVIHITTSKSGGAGIAAQRISDSLRFVGVDSDLWDRRQILNELNLGIIERFKIHVASPVLTGLQKNFVQKGSELMTPNSLSLINFSRFNDLDIDLIHVHSFYNLLNARSFQELAQLNKPVVITLHDLRLITGGCHAEVNCKKYQDDCSACPKVYKVFRSNVANQKERLTSIIQEGSNITLVSPSEWLSSRILMSGYFPKSRVKVINNPAPRNFESSRLGRIQKGRLAIGFSAYDLQSPYKGLEVLIKAIRSLPTQTQSQIDLHLKGNNFPESKFFLGVESVIFNADKVHMSKFYRSVDAVVVPSLADNFPSVAIEAIASNCILISSDSGGLKEISETNKGFLFTNKNFIQLGEILLELIKDEGLHQSKYDGKYSYHSIGTKYKELYSESIS
jgi:glycosyltransferase involved in cell wall biosynthesis